MHVRTREIRRVRLRIKHSLDFGFRNVSIICFFACKGCSQGCSRPNEGFFWRSWLEVGQRSLLGEHTFYVDEFFPASSPGKNLAHAHNCVLLRVRITVC